MTIIKRQFVSDIITKEEILKWEEKSIVRLKSDPGTGKSYWVGEVLGNLVEEKDEKILMVVHRLPLKKDLTSLFQNMNLLNTHIEIVTYQLIEQKFRTGVNPVEQFKDYNYIIYDEFQYIYKDSGFNSNTDQVVRFINDIKGSDGIANQLIITANKIIDPFVYDYIYDISDKSRSEYDISERVNKGFLISSIDHIKAACIAAINKGEQAAVFINDTDIIEDLYNTFKEYSTLYVSQQNRLSSKMDDKQLKLISKENRFTTPLLLATGVMDAGVSLKMDNLKHIIVKERTLDGIYQFVGRKRMLNENDRFNLYIMDYHPQVLGGYLTNNVNELELARMFKEDSDKFFRIYGRENIDNHLFYRDIDGNTLLNEVRETELLNRYYELHSMLNYTYKGYAAMKLNVMLYDVVGKVKEKNMKEKLDDLVGIELLGVKDRKPLIDTINVRSGGRQMKSLNSLNAALEEMNLPYRIVCYEGKRDIDGKNKRFKRIWKLNKFEEN